jgi:hypothetical protein
MTANELHAVQLAAKQAELDALQVKYEQVLVQFQAEIAHRKRCQNILAKRPSTTTAKWDTLKAQCIAAMATGHKAKIVNGECVVY